MYNPPMALNRPALVDALTNAGLESEAVRRVVDVLEQSYADTAQQTEMNLRFSALEKNLADHDRLNEAQNNSLETRLQDFKDEVERRFVDLKESMEREFAAVRNEMRNEFAAIRNEMNGKITMLQWVVGGLFVMNATTLGIVIDKLL